MGAIRPGSFGKSRIVPPAVNLLVRNPVPVSTAGVNFTGAVATGSTTSWVSSGGPFGGGFVRFTVGTASTVAGTDFLQYGDPSWVAGSGSTLPGALPVAPNETHVLSCYIRMSRANPVFVQAQYLAGAGGAQGSTGSPSVTPVVNTWTRLSGTGVAGADAQALRFDVDLNTPVSWQVGDTCDVACFMISAGPTLLPWTAGFRAAM